MAGSGRINGRPALAGSEDVTVLGGSIGSGSADKRYRLCQLARQERVPLVMMLEGAGHRVTEAASGRRPGDLMGLAELSGMVPLVSLVCGASAGHGALTAPLCDFVAMTESASIFAAGPPLVRSATGEDVTKEELGGPAVAAAVRRRGAQRRGRRPRGHRPGPPLPRLLSDQRMAGAAPARPGPDTGRRRVDLLPLIPPDPRRPYPIRPVLASSGRRRGVARGAARIRQLDRHRCSPTSAAGAWPSWPTIRASLAGTIDSDAADKAAHFLDVADAFGLPCVFLADNPGVLAGTAAERQGILRHAARLFAVQHRMRVPKLHVTLRKAFGFGSSVMAMNPFDGQTVTLALPSVTLGALPAASAASGIDDQDERARLAAEQAEASVRAAARLSYDDVVDPRDLRDALLSALDLAEGRDTGLREPRALGILP